MIVGGSKPSIPVRMARSRRPASSAMRAASVWSAGVAVAGMGERSRYRPPGDGRGWKGGAAWRPPPVSGHDGRVELSMTLPTMLAQGREEVLGWCRAVDEGPWADLAVPERVTYPSHSLTVHLAAAAALTERVRLWTTIVILPAHNAVQVAKDLASVDQLCAGRLTVGVGVGGRED